MLKTIFYIVGNDIGIFECHNLFAFFVTNLEKIGIIDLKIDLSYTGNRMDYDSSRKNAKLLIIAKSYSHYTKFTNLPAAGREVNNEA